ncbi:helix-turn-helix domain-containing protein [Streptomyces cellulosae]
MHSNTVSRRLEGITELSGADRQHPERLLEIQLALEAVPDAAELCGGGRSRPGRPLGVTEGATRA